MKFLFDLFPVVLFFIAFKLFDIYVATAVTIVATFVQ
ncbi:MAG: septation protein A, partial [Nitrosomonadaceae bacterium]|nr:septation protein A [Nitrosomonadaceae bacterium]